VMMTARVDELDRLLGLDAGADDYICKPYSPREVVARVHAVLRRSAGSQPVEQVLRYENLRVDLLAFTAAIEHRDAPPQWLELTPTEFKLLATLLKTPSKAFTRDELLEICLPESEALARVVDAHVHNLRRKLETHGIAGVLVTVRSIGYRFR
jgi:two-component system, OmpR family, response regulator AdeR